MTDKTVTLKFDPSNVQEILGKILVAVEGIRSTQELPLFLDLEEVAKISKFSPNTIRKAISDGRLKAHRPEGKNYRISREDFLRWMSSTPPAKITTVTRVWEPGEYASGLLSFSPVRVDRKKLIGSAEDSVTVTQDHVILSLEPDSPARIQLTAVRGKEGVPVQVMWMGNTWCGKGTLVGPTNNKDIMFNVVWNSPLITETKIEGDAQ